MLTRIINAGLFSGETANGKPIYIKDAAIDFNGGKILYAGNAAAAPAHSPERVVDGAGCVAIPGIANAHTHAAMVLLRGYGSDLNLHDWLHKKIFPAENKLTAEDVYFGSSLAFLEMLRFGVTASCDMYFMEDEIVRAAADTGIRLAVVNPAVGSAKENRPQIDNMERTFVKHNDTHGGRVRALFGVHAEYTSDADMVRLVADKAKELGAGIHVHISETQSEVEGCYARHGVSPVRYFEKLGLFDRPTMAAHCVRVNAEDIRILADNGVTVAHNPVSNLKLASGAAPVPAMLAAGVKVALGTDGASSNNNLNIWEEMRLMSILHKGTSGNPIAVTPAQTLAAATVNGMRGMGFHNAGIIKEGWDADIVLIDTNGLHHCPAFAEEPEADLVYSAQGSDVVMTIVAGEVRYDHGIYPGIDVEPIKKAVRESATRITQ
ncbi:MAG: amidohydrolase [Oscillospiraceae bacterium]|jgi:5-methylthioadenosine/S-adenosylhomocysteine deaminase|nr:amidohydrolase [Oscillospiraceae bacterium]